MTREEFEYAIKSCGCFIYRGQTYYEETELMKAFEDMGLIKQEQSGDSISRQAVLDLLEDTNNGWIINEVLQLPSVKPQSCEDAISRQAVLDLIANYDLSMGQVVRGIHALPSVKPQEKTGHWIEHPEIETSTPEYLMFYECSECGDKQCFCKSDIHKKHFCNNCGARMIVPQESEIRV